MDSSPMPKTSQHNHSDMPLLGAEVDLFMGSPKVRLVRSVLRFRQLLSAVDVIHGDHQAALRREIDQAFGHGRHHHLAAIEQGHVALRAAQRGAHFVLGNAQPFADCFEHTHEAGL